jgi:hypothetical protein
MTTSRVRLFAAILVLFSVAALVGAALEEPFVWLPAGLIAAAGGIALGLYIQRQPPQP